MHQKPDGDAMGSTLGLYHFLIQFGHDITVISPTNWASFLDWMPASNTVLDYEKETKKSDKLNFYNEFRVFQCVLLLVL